MVKNTVFDKEDALTMVPYLPYFSTTMVKNTVFDKKDELTMVPYLSYFSTCYHGQKYTFWNKRCFDHGTIFILLLHLLPWSKTQYLKKKINWPWYIFYLTSYFSYCYNGQKHSILQKRWFDHGSLCFCFYSVNTMVKKPLFSKTSFSVFNKRWSHQGSIFCWARRCTYDKQVPCSKTWSIPYKWEQEWCQ